MRESTKTPREIVGDALDYMEGSSTTLEELTAAYEQTHRLYGADDICLTAVANYLRGKDAIS